MRRLLAAALVAFVGSAAAAEEEVALPRQHWSFSGFFGTYDRAAALRGLQVYREVCAGCHSLSLLSYRHLGGLGLDEEAVKALAAEETIVDGPDESGEMFERPGRPSDRFRLAFPNEQAARAANNGAFPPDLSVIVKARKGGADYVYALLVGYGEPPAEVTLQDGMSYNAYFPGGQIAMPPPLSDDAVAYADGTPAGADQLALDVVHFLAWAAEPELDERKRTGVKTVLFLIVFTGLLYAVKRKVWSRLH